MIYDSHASMNNSNDDALYIKSAPSELEWKDCWYRQYVGHVLTGGEFRPQFSKEKIEQSTDEGEKSMRKNAFNFFFCGYKTINFSDVIKLDHAQLHDYKGHLRHGNRLNLGERENSWTEWEEWEKNYYKDRF